VEPPDRWDRLVRSSSTSGRPLRKLPRLSRYSLPSSIPFMAYLNRCLATAIKTPRAPPPSPFRPPAGNSAKSEEFLIGALLAYGHLHTDSAPTMNPVLPLPSKPSPSILTHPLMPSFCFISQ
jgi:hypothetical protein